MAIVCRLARRTLGDQATLPWDEFEDDYDPIRDRIARVVPGFDDFNRRLAAAAAASRCPTRRATSAASPLPHGKSAAHRATRSRSSGCRRAGCCMQTVRSHDQYNTTIYGLDDRYRGIHQGRRVVFVHPDDLAELSAWPTASTST